MAKTLLYLVVWGWATASAGPPPSMDCPSDGQLRRIVGEDPQGGTEVWCEAPDFFGGTTRNGPYRYFDDGGRLRVAGEFLNGRRHGAWTFYGPDGELEETRRYRNGRLVSRQRTAGRVATSASRSIPSRSRPSQDVHSGPKEGTTRSEMSWEVDDDQMGGTGVRKGGTWLFSAAGPGKAATFGLAARLVLFVPMADFVFRGGITDFYSIRLRGSSVGILNLADLDNEVRLFQSGGWSTSLVAGGSLSAIFGLGTEAVYFGPKPGVRFSFGGPRVQVTAGLDVPLYVFSSLATSQVQTDFGTTSAGGGQTGLWVALRPEVGVEFPVGKTVHMYVQATLEHMVVEESGGVTLSQTLPLLAVGANWDLRPRSGRRRGSDPIMDF